MDRLWMRKGEAKDRLWIGYGCKRDRLWMRKGEARDAACRLTDSHFHIFTQKCVFRFSP